MRSVAALSGNGLSDARHPVVQGERRGLRTDPRYDEVVLGSLFERRVGEWTSTSSPLRARGVSGLPSALVITAQYDPLRDEGEFSADKLKTAGVTTASRRYDGVNHGFMFWVGIVDKAGMAMSEACGWLRDVFADPH
jgi:acetyl esterase/lipase